MKPTSALLQPPSQLASCLFAAIVRDTRGTTLSDVDRFNHFPASPLVSVTYVISGRIHVVPTGCSLEHAQEAPPISQQSVLPPQDEPVSSWSPGPVAVVTIGFYPEAWKKLEKGNAEHLVFNTLEATFGDLRQGEDLDIRMAKFAKAFDPVWQAVRATGGLGDWAGSMLLTDWSRSIIGRAALAGPGRSLRAFERRLRRWSKQSRQSLKFYSDIENLHRLASNQITNSPAALANDAGYSDQSHMGRAVRRATGFSPAHLNTLIKTKEAFWCYRLLGERF